MNLKLLIDWTIPEGLAEIYAESNSCVFVGKKDRVIDLAAALVILQNCASTKEYDGFERLGIMKIYHGGVVVGFSMPRKIEAKEKIKFKLKEDDTYHRIGPVYITKAHRGKGIMSKTIQEFQNIVGEMIWTCNELNDVSAKAALSGGLKYSHHIYVTENRQYLFNPFPNQVRVDLVYKSNNICHSEINHAQ